MFEFRNLYSSCVGELTGLYPSNCVLSHLFLKTRAHFHFHFVSFALARSCLSQFHFYVTRNRMISKGQINIYLAMLHVI